MPKIQRIIVPDIPPPVSHYCHVTRAGPLVWVAGVVGQAQDGSIPSDVVAQFDIAIAVMDKCLKAAGAGPERGFVRSSTNSGHSRGRLPCQLSA
jgi:enamine deaminase RidA (YjgF/YER057c/UK114 family)